MPHKIQVVLVHDEYGTQVFHSAHDLVEMEIIEIDFSRYYDERIDQQAWDWRFKKQFKKIEIDEAREAVIEYMRINFFGKVNLDDNTSVGKPE